MGPQFAFEILRNIDCFALIISYISIMTWHILFNVRIDQFANPDLCPSNHQRGQGVHDKEIYQRQVPSKTVFWITSSCVSCFGAIDGTQDDQSQIRWDKIEILWKERWSTILHLRSSICICICVIVFVFLYLYSYLYLRDENSLEGEMFNHSRSSISGQWEPQHIASFVLVHRELLFILHPRSIVFVRKTFTQIDAACSSGLTTNHPRVKS